MIINELLRTNSVKYSNNIAIRDSNSNICYTHQQIAALAQAASYWLLKKGIQRGDRICILSNVCLETIIIFYGAANLGAITVFLDVSIGSEPLRYIINQLEPRLTLSSNQGLKNFQAIGVSAETIIPTFLKEVAPNIAHHQSLKVAELQTQADDPAVIIYTSGSTGHPKGVMISQAALCRSAQLLADFYKWNARDIFLNLGELHMMSGLRNTCLTYLIAGASVLIAQPSHLNSLFSILELIAKYKITILGVAPTFLHHLKLFSNKITNESLKSLKVILSTGSMLDPLLATWIYQHFGIPVLNYYGLTETTGFCAGHNLESFLRDPSGIGIPVGATIDIVNEQDQILGYNEIGEIRISSSNLMLGYYKNSQLTCEVIKNNKFYTGDLAIKKPDNSIILAGRKKHFIKNNLTEMVHFEEVELFIEKYPAVLEAGVCSFKSTFDCERLAAFIVPTKPITTPTVFFNNLKKFLQQCLGKNKVPAEFFLLTKLPRNSAGKLMRKQLEEIFHHESISK
jgi:acyl-coenzyme A synthetase/AMP-(fatty) acid ligase